MKFNETKLLNHPTVRGAFKAMTAYFSNSPNFHAHAIEAAEIISTTVKNPDPDVVAAAIFMPPQVIKKVSAAAADYMEQYFDAVDEKKTPLFASEGARQLAMAHGIMDLREARENINNGKYWGARDAQYWIDKAGKPLAAAAENTTADRLAGLALAELNTTQKTLDDLVKKTQAEAAFGNMGLPDHPTLRAAYKLMRDNETSNDAMYHNQSGLGAGAARILYETGASTDPDVLAAAILNQYLRAVPKKLSDGLTNAKSFEDMEDAGRRIDAYNAAHPHPLTQNFSARLVELYRETSPMSHDGEARKQHSRDGSAIIVAIHVHILEEMLASYAAPEKKPGYDSYGALERIEDYAFMVKNTLATVQHPGLKARMEKDLAAAEAVINAPSNVLIRKPGSPHRDMGW